jgi:hypothetical protein
MRLKAAFYPNRPTLPSVRLPQRFSGFIAPCRRACRWRALRRRAVGSLRCPGLAQRAGRLRVGRKSFPGTAWGTACVRWGFIGRPGEGLALGGERSQLCSVGLILRENEKSPHRLQESTRTH